MPKNIALFDYVEVDGTDLSTFCKSITADFTDSEEDVSGFNAAGTDETLPGTRSQAITFEFFNDKDAGSVHDTLYPIWRDRETVLIKTRDDQNNPVSATNPELRGYGKMYGYSPQRTRGTADSFSVTFRAADANGFAYEDAS